MRTSIPSVCLLFLAACGGGASSSAFHASYPDNDPAAVAGVVARLDARAPDAERPVVVGVSRATPREVYAFDLARGALLFRKALTPVASPVIAGRVVLVETADEVVALALDGGDVVFQLSTSASTGRVHLVGAGGEGDVVALALGAGDGGGTGSVYVYEGRSRRFASEVPHAVGAPTVAGGLVFVPWAYQNVSVLDARTGDELSRVRVTDTMVGHVFTAGADVYVGQRGLFRFTPAIVRGNRSESAHYAPPETGLPQAPELMRDAYAPPPALASATHRVRFTFRPGGEGDTVSLVDDTLYLVFFRMLFALDAANGSARWFADAGTDVVGADAFAGGLVAIDANGVVTAFDTRGLPAARHETAIPTELAVVRAAGLAIERDENATPLSLREQLVAAVRTSDARLVPARRFALRTLAALPEDDVTADLMGLCEDRRLPPPVKEEACAVLARRPTGPAPILAGLARTPSFLEGTSAPEVAALARAAGSMREARAVPLLVEQLFEPTTTIEGVAAIADALGAIGDPSAAAPLLAFLRLYHADIEDFEMVASMKRVAAAYAALAGPSARMELATLAGDTMCEPGLASHMSALARQLAGSTQTPTSSAPTTTTQTEELPTHVTVQMAADVLDPVRGSMNGCLEEDAARPRSARVSIVLERDGSVRQLSVTPASVQACMEPYVRTRRFPATRGRGTHTVTFTLRAAD